MNMGKRDPQLFLDYALGAIENFLAQTRSYGDVIYKSEFKTLKDSLNGKFEISSKKLAPCDLILEYYKELLPGHWNLINGNKTPPSRNETFFDDLYYSSWTLARASSLVKKTQKIVPDNEIEKEVLDVLKKIAFALEDAGKKVLELDLLPGRRKLEEWERKPEPDKFTCSCCFRRQAKNPYMKNMMADHGFVKAGYRKGICAGAGFPALEQSGEGNLAFLSNARKELALLKSGLAKKMLADDYDGKSLDIYRDMRDIQWKSDEIDFRKFLADGMDYAGGYKEFLDKKLNLRTGKSRHDKLLYSRAFNLDDLVDRAAEFLEEKNACPDKSFLEWFSEQENIPSRFFASIADDSKEDENSVDPSFQYFIDKKVSFNELANYIETYVLINAEMPFAPWLRKTFVEFAEMPENSSPKIAQGLF